MIGYTKEITDDYNDTIRVSSSGSAYNSDTFVQCVEHHPHLQNTDGTPQVRGRTTMQLNRKQHRELLRVLLEAYEYE